MDGPVTEEPAPETPHRLVNPESLRSPSGYSHAVVAAPGRLVQVAGQTALRADGSMPEDLVEQFDAAAANVAAALAAAGARPEHIVSMMIFTTDLDGYLAASEPIGQAYRRHFGRHFGASALIEVKGLVGGAKVELVCAAVIPESG